jgi:hypothetical protein
MSPGGVLFLMNASRAEGCVPESRKAVNPSIILHSCFSTTSILLGETMAFPDNWAQTFLVLPGSLNPGLENTWGVYQQWWMYDVEPDWSTWLWYYFDQDYNDWMQNCVGSILKSQGPANQFIEWRAFINSPTSGIHQDFNGSLGDYWDNDSVLPAVSCMVVRTFATNGGQQIKGRKYLSCVSSAAVDGGALKASTQRIYQIIMQSMLDPFISQGTTFTPCIASRKHNTLFPYERCTVNFRLGNIKRRGRRTRYPGRFFNQPLAPP